MNNPYWKNICAIAELQRAKGIATYGQGIEMNPADVITRIEYLQEELVDALMYCEWIKDGIKCTAKWIPVTERLPEEWEDVLIWSKCGFCETAVYIGIPGKWRVSWNHTMLDEDTVTHWMPLPEPPKED